MHRDGPVEGAVHGVLGPGRAVPRRVLPPGHLVGNKCGAEDVHVPVSVHIRRMHRVGPVEGAVHGVLGPGRAVPRRVLPPGDVGGIRRGAEDVPVHIRRMHRVGRVEGAVHGVLGPGRAVPRRVLPPGDLVRVKLCGAEDVHVPVPVHIRRMHRVGRVEVAVHGVLGRERHVRRPQAPGKKTAR